MIYVEIARCER